MAMMQSVGRAWTANGGDQDLGPSRIRPGTWRRVLAHLRPYSGKVALFGLMAVTDSVIVAATPLLLRLLINDGILKHDRGYVVLLACLTAMLAVMDALAQLALAHLVGRIGQGVCYDLRVRSLKHLQRLPVAFFNRTQTGVLIDRLHTQLVMTQVTLSQLLMATTSGVTVALVLAELFYLSWLVAILTLVLIPMLLVPWMYVGRRMQQHARRLMEVNAGLSGLLQERLNVQGAMLSKLFGRPGMEMAEYEDRAGRIRRTGVKIVVYTRMTLIIMGFTASLATALIYGVGGWLALDGALQIGTLVALATLLARMFGPITQLSGIQANGVTILVCFDRIFEVLDLKPLIVERPDATVLTKDTVPDIEFEDVSFRYPSADEVSLPSLEVNVRAAREHGEREHGELVQEEVLHEVSLHVPAGTLTALVGPSGAGKTTLTYLVSRLYDPTSGTVRVGGHDLRDLTFDSLRETVGVVSQDAYLFHDTIRENLLYARPDATEDELIEACAGAQIWDLIESLPDGFETVVGDRGYRMSGGEKQRLAIARLLLKAPSVVVLDEATAHLDTGSEAAIQRALKVALRNRTSLVIAHRLSTIREADRILVIDGGRVRESGTHEELLAEGGLYAELYHTQFAKSDGDEGGSGGNGFQPVHQVVHDQVVHGGAPSGSRRGL